MPGQNYSTTSKFILFGFSAFPQELLPSALHRLHRPMDLFLWTLSISEILFPVSVTPCMLADLISTHRSITFVACTNQMFFSFMFGFTHSFLLMVTGYDCYVAICHPLHYHVLMSPHGCAHLVAWTWAGGSVMGIMVTSIVFHLTFCRSNGIHHLACHVLSLLKLACGDKTSSVIMGVMLVHVTALIGCLFLCILSYVFIVAATLRIPSPKGPHSMYSDTLMATTCTVFTAFLNPIMFSLRNRS
uniref:G-protein coupled receptors family 1 profile domain-containing protein n=1 Tax=Propithecus coquereli TaxID=379532 RepID=A0A2K6EH71_PROCO